MARPIYVLLSYLLLPFLAVYLLWRSRKQPEYREHWGERFGWTAPMIAQGAIWIHAVSLGETLAAESLIVALRQLYPERPLLLTHTTPTGRAAGLRLAPRISRLTVMYLPYDTPWAMRRFLSRAKPCAGLLMETEVWPNLIACAQAMNIPLALINARLSERSLARGQKYSSLAREAMGALSMVLAQTSDDARRLAQIGAKSPQVLGNLKFDVQPSPELLARGKSWRQHFSRKQVVLFANTREGEEMMLLSALKLRTKGFKKWPEGLLVLLVPRHPQRFNDVEKVVQAEGLRYVRRSCDTALESLSATPNVATLVHQLAPLDSKIQLVLGDSLGEMAAYYAASDLAVMGGSFQKLGGHNLIEACACVCPVILGPHMFNFALASQEAVASGAAWSVQDAQEAIAKALQLLSTDRAPLQKASAACKEFSQKHRGATLRTLEALAPLLPLR